jgi:Uma2 family endonuclease
MAVRAKTTVGDLYRVVGDAKAELVGGELVAMAPTGDWPASAAGAIYASLREHARRTRSGRAYGDNVGFLVDLPNRQSFSPDAAYHTGLRTGMRFLEGAPVFAVEVRSEGEYGPAAERAIAAKRGDYFAAGTVVVWDVDLLAPEVVRVYRTGEPDRPTVYRRGEMAEAEPAVPGWTLPVDDLFE